MLRNGRLSAFATGFMVQLFLIDITTGHPYQAIVSLVLASVNAFLWWELSRDDGAAERTNPQ